VLERQRTISLESAVGLGEFFSSSSSVIFLLSINKALVHNIETSGGLVIVIFCCRQVNIPGGWDLFLWLLRTGTLTIYFKNDTNSQFLMNFCFFPDRK
jgi:hypothetical protein